MLVFVQLPKQHQQLTSTYGDLTPLRKSHLRAALFCPFVTMVTYVNRGEYRERCGRRHLRVKPMAEDFAIGRWLAGQPLATS